MAKAKEDLPICKGGSGMFFPLGGKWEAELPQGVQVILYMAGLCYCFLGVTIISDIFMTSIERITSRKVRRFDKVLKKQRTVRVWNDTVANLTLMALGSSAPEILLNVIEIFKLNFKSGPLGPSTIVGSAAFNLLGISAVCVVAIPNGEIRKIKDVTVYAVTASFSIFAYLWLLFILVGTSPHVVEVWESVLTFIFFPILIAIAFAADKGWLTGGQGRQDAIQAHDLSKEELAALVKEIKAECQDGVELDDHTLMVLVHTRHESNQPKSRARYRVQTSRFTNITNNGPTLKPKPELEDEMGPAATAPADEVKDSGPKVWVEFVSPYYTVSEAAQAVVTEVGCRREGVDAHVSVKYRTLDGSAKKGSDYVAREGTLEFKPGCDKQDLRIEIVDDTEWEEAENFFIELSDPVVDTKVKNGEDIDVVLTHAKATITIIDDDDPGKIAWVKDEIQLQEELVDKTYMVKVQRRSGSRGEVSCRCTTEPDSAVAPLDFEAIDQEVTFQDGELEKEVPLVIKAKGRFEVSERLRLVLSEPKGCRLDKDTDGGEDSDICWVEIRPNEAAKSSVEWVARHIHYHSNQVRLGRAHWRDQFLAAIYPEGDCWADAQQAKGMDWAVHIVTCPWKFLFAFVPPTDFLDGWLCFVMALVGIGGITAVIGDLAELLGCALGWNELITAITFVALGTSLPDTFASKTAAMMDPYADASIGNITGSNSVNVFLGLGLPWTIGAIKWFVEGKTEEWLGLLGDAPEPSSAGLVVKAGGLGFSVAAFVACAALCMSLLSFRRLRYGGELGGPSTPKWFACGFLSFLWLGYVGSSWVYLEMAGSD